MNNKKQYVRNTVNKSRARGNLHFTAYEQGLSLTMLELAQQCTIKKMRVSNSQSLNCTLGRLLLSIYTYRWKCIT